MHACQGGLRLKVKKIGRQWGIWLRAIGCCPALQEQQLRDLFDEHSGRPDRFEKIAEEMGMDGLTAAKVSADRAAADLVCRRQLLS